MRPSLPSIPKLDKVITRKVQTNIPHKYKVSQQNISKSSSAICENNYFTTKWDLSWNCKVGIARYSVINSYNPEY